MTARSQSGPPQASTWILDDKSKLRLWSSRQVAQADRTFDFGKVLRATPFEPLEPDEDLEQLFRSLPESP